jgi:hypothetical protein
MSIQQIKAEAANLSEAQRRELIGYLVALGRSKDGAYWDKIERKIADNDPSHWVSESGLDSALRLNEPGA